MLISASVLGMVPPSPLIITSSRSSSIVISNPSFSRQSRKALESSLNKTPLNLQVESDIAASINALLVMLFDPGTFTFIFFFSLTFFTL